MALIPTTDPLNEAMNNGIIKSEHRAHSGLSQIGHNCHRYLQFVHYWAYDIEISERVNRLFNVGHREEDVMTDALAKQGYKVVHQQREVIGFSGHWKGHIDGIVTSPQVQNKLIEFKTHNDKSFKDLMKKTVQLSKPVHYAQMQSYMGYLGLEEAMYMAYNKNDSAYYIEVIKFDEEKFSELKRKEEEVMLSESLLPRIGTNSPTWFECKWCDAKDVCFKREEPPVNCRTCSNAHVMNDGKWVCGFTNDELSMTEQRAACDKYKMSIIFGEG